MTVPRMQPCLPKIGDALSSLPSSSLLRALALDELALQLRGAVPDPVFELGVGLAQRVFDDFLLGDVEGHQHDLQKLAAFFNWKHERPHPSCACMLGTIELRGVLDQWKLYHLTRKGLFY